ncbi:integral membrane channel protein [Histoplasma capsulatum H143]|uniref:Integral membrane channel protein n=1 Tax=Ajellomyces capsulatus (strain H143) TaxID=544712 RepID=C6HF17_AJECH|nr:integral membrane channel protein [Histoplasma capsulatum H143]
MSFAIFLGLFLAVIRRWSREVSSPDLVFWFCSAGFMFDELVGHLHSQHHDQNVSSTLAMELGSDIGDNEAVGGGFIGAIPSSFVTEMANATGGLRRLAPTSIE